MHRQRTVRWLLAAVTFVIGLFAGGIIVGFVSGGSDEPVPSPTVTVTAPANATPTGSAASTATAGSVGLSADCLRAVNDAQDTYAAVGSLVDALQKLNLSAIDAVIQRLQPLEQRLRRDIGLCKVVAQLPTVGPSPSGS